MARPKAIRVPIAKLNSIECAAVFSTRQAIVKKDAIHHHIDPPALTIKSVITIISDRILNKAHPGGVLHVGAKGHVTDTRAVAIELLVNVRDFVRFDLFSA